MLAARHGLTNLRIVSQDAVEVLGCRLASGSLDEIVIWFPDPWPKKRHAKRRIVQVATATLMADRLARGGLLRFATDWQPYAEHARDVLNGHPDFGNCAPDRGFVSRPADRLLTKFERRGLRLGHAVYDLAFARR